MARITPGHDWPVTLHLRRLDWRDLREVERHLLALEPAARLARFGAVRGDAAIAAYAWRIDPARAVLIGAVNGASGRIVGLAEAQPTAAPRRVEMAVSVLRPHRCRGLGRQLATAALVVAFARGAEVAECFFDPSNGPIVGLVRALRARIDATQDRAELRRGDTVAWSQPT